MGVVNYYHAHNINAQREWQLGWQRRVALSALMVMSTREYCWISGVELFFRKRRKSEEKFLSIVHTLSLIH